MSDGAMLKRLAEGLALTVISLLAIIGLAAIPALFIAIFGILDGP